MGLGTGLMKSLMFVFNGIVWVLGLVLFVVGIVVLVEGENWNEIIDGKTVPVSVLLIIVGLVIAIVGFLGCFGAMKQNSGMLLVYAIVLGVVILVQLVAGILAFIYSDEAGDFARTGMQKGLRDYGLSSSLTEGVDWVQSHLECCGVDDHLDWTKTSVAYYWVAMAGHRNDAPDSCCVDFRTGCGEDRATSGFNLWEQDCYRAVYDAVLDRGMIMGLLGVGVVVIELVAMLLSYKIRELTNEEVRKEKKRQERKSKRYANPYET